jgi:hypothetical protein
VASFSVFPALAIAQESTQAPIQVTVQGQTLGWADITAFMRAFNPHAPQFRIKVVRKEPADMPSDARYVSYQGQDPASPSTEIVWIASDARPFADPRVVPSAQRASEEFVAAMALGMMDSGTAGPKLEAIYASTPANRIDRIALGKSFAEALVSASNQEAAIALSETQWIQAHIVPGMTRTAAYQALRSQGLTAYNYNFVKGKSIPAFASPSPDHATIGGGCSRSDASSGAWPYQGEPLPKQEGMCAQMFARAPTSIPNPDADVDLGGAFNLACSWSTRIVLSFTDDDRVEAVNVGQPRPNCA